MLSKTKYIIGSSYLLILFLFLQPNTFAQKETANWIFGMYDNWVIFTDSGPIPYSPPNNIQWQPDFFESGGCASTISDKEGNLILYTNAESVWNGQLQYLGYPNGHWWGSTIIIPSPGNSTRFYIITTLYAGLTGLKIYQVDMSLNSGSGGNVYNESFGTNLVPKIATTYHSNQKDIWLIAHDWNSNSFRSVLITEQIPGASPFITTTPVISNVGLIQQDTAVVDLWNSASVGKMKISPGGNHIAMSSNGLNAVEIFDYDKETGIVSNPRTINIDRPFCLEFSPNGTLLYIGQLYKCFLSGCTLPNVTKHVYQLDLMAGTGSETDIQNSMTIVSSYLQSSDPPTGPQFQLASDMKIYVDVVSWEVPVISNPNLLGTNCNWTPDGIVFPNGWPGTGPIQLFPDFFTPFLDFNILFENACFEDSTMIYTKTNQGFDSICWDFSDPTLGNFSFPNQDTIFYKFSLAGNYPITLKRYRNGNLDELTKLLKVLPKVNINLNIDTMLCQGAELEVSVSDSLCEFVWLSSLSYDSIFSDTIQISQNGTYWPIVTNFDGICGSIDTVQVQYAEINSELGVDLNDCISNPLILSPTFQYADSLLWSTGESTDSIFANQAGLYFVSVYYAGCYDYDSINVDYEYPLNPHLGSDVFLCLDDSVNLFGGSFLNTDYFWLPSFETTEQIFVSNSGEYILSVSNICGTYSDSILVNDLNPPVVNLGNDTILCIGDSLILDATNPQSIYSWMDVFYDSAVTVWTTNNYWVIVENQCGSATDSISVEFHIPLEINLGNDTTICNSDSLQLSIDNFLFFIANWSTGETGLEIFVQDSGNYWVEVENACGIFSDTINLNLDFPIEVNLGNDTTICASDSLQLSIANNQSSFANWSTGDTVPEIFVQDSGNYWVQIENACGIFSDSINLNLDFPLELNLGNDTIICHSDSLQLSINNYQSSIANWSTGETSSEIFVSDSGIYWVNIENACGFFSDTMELFVSNPQFSFPVDTLGMYSGYIELMADSGWISYLWENGETTNQTVVSDTGWFSLQVFDSLACSTSDSIYILDISAIPENDEIIVSNDFILILYPNPGTGIFNLKIFAPDDDYCSVDIFNINGQNVFYQNKLDLLKGWQEHQIDLSTNSDGVYNILLNSDKFEIQTKLVLIK
ncbi:MAG: T9SS type A sorting domain-containing protein [Bacteroidetes bacterium]|nr:T9SS type A sorting domain-containing protein [Bacteroidota bacterium]MBT6687897.1 T9SS type A sorting domain-containing protein [Bacteroidota bacterium]MBT7142455.1 T9SS type A sorting domain-containing protein [Bacteroidota bacterium]MBT7490038.1 T9SS type A sorting domain-containing protein [Bacteroidota bacterium]